MMLQACTIPSPVGELTLVADAGALVAILWKEDRARQRLGQLGDGVDHPVLDAAAIQLGAYFAGSRVAFDLSLRLRGTLFQHAVWGELARIPFGETRSYAAIARAIGRPTATRAVGAANGCNPLPIVVPCHRVVGSGGALTGFAGGLDAKRRLLAFERRA